MNDLVLSFLQYNKEKGLSKNTLDAYTRDVAKFIEYLKLNKMKINELEKDDMNSYLQYLKKEKMANSSITRNMVSIKSFYKYLCKKDIIKFNTLMEYELPKIHRKMPAILSIEEVEILLNSPDINTNKGKRDKAMMEIMYATGVKVNELLKLTVYDIDLNENYIKCKNSINTERFIPIGSYAVNCMKSYLNIREDFNSLGQSLLFLNSRGSKMSRQGFWKILKEYGKNSNIKKNINLYTLRHSFAVHLLQNGANLNMVQQLLGHKNISATQIYSQISKNDKIAEVYKLSHPRA